MRHVRVDDPTNECIKCSLLQRDIPIDVFVPVAWHKDAAVRETLLKKEATHLLVSVIGTRCRPGDNRINVVAEFMRDLSRERRFPA